MKKSKKDRDREARLAIMMLVGVLLLLIFGVAGAFLSSAL